MEFSNLYQLIQCLQYGTCLHIGVLFFNDYVNEKCQLPSEHTIHSREVCRELKGKGKKGFKRCFRCRNLAIQKALTGKKPFAGISINGIYEYTHPVVIEGDVACVIYIGNILESALGREKLERNLAGREELIGTLEKDFSYEKCAAIGNLVESYIRFLLEKYGHQSKSKNPLIENVKTYLQANLEYDISLSHITAIFHYNQQYMGRLFKKETGLSIREYILQQRLRRAKLLLDSSTAPVSELAGQVGFNSVTYFNRQFKETYGMSPTGYRNRHSAKDEDGNRPRMGR